MSPRRYLDHAASTPMRPAAIASMEPWWAQSCANPSGGHASAQRAKAALEAAREQVAICLGAEPDEVVFTGGGSEGDNLAIKGAVWAARNRDPLLTSVVTTGIEHKAVLGAAHRIGIDGGRATIVGAGVDGRVDLDALAAALDATTAVVSVMAVNNETGVIQLLDDVTTLVRIHAPNAAVHTDAVQAPQWLDVGVVAAGPDLVAISGHKFGGPKGVGALVVRRGVELVPLVEGGGHEWGLRAGTQNVAGIVGLAAALTETHRERSTETARIAALRDRFERELIARVTDVEINGARDARVEGISHVAIAGVEAETLLVALDHRGVDAASGSACSSGAVDPSHVLLAMGMDRLRALSCVRFSFGWASTDDDVDGALDAVVDAVAQLRVPASR